MLKLLPILICLCLPLSAQAGLVVLHQYGLGEAGTFSGALPQDSVGGAHFQNGAFAGTATAGVTAPGSTDYALAGRWFNGIISSTVPADDFGMEIWVQTANPNSTSTIVTSGGGSSLRLTQSGGNFVGSIGENINILGSAAATSAWTHLAIIRDSGVSTFYVNGVATGSTSTVTPVRNSVHVGVRPGGGQTLASGTGLDELRFFTWDDPDDDPVSFLNISPVPEPSAGVLFAMACLGLIRRRRARN